MNMKKTNLSVSSNIGITVSEGKDEQPYPTSLHLSGIP